MTGTRPSMAVGQAEINCLLCSKELEQFRREPPSLCLNLSYEPCQNLIERSGHPDDGATMEDHAGLILRLIVITEDGHGVLAHRIADAINAGDKDEAGDPLSLNGHIYEAPCRTRHTRIYRTYQEHTL